MSDIKLDANYCAAIAANGELILTHGVDTLCQDIRLRLVTLIGSLFYNSAYGSNVPLFIHDDEADDASVESEIIRCVEKDPRVEPYSVDAKVLKRDEKSISVSLSWVCVGNNTTLNEVIELKK